MPLSKDKTTELKCEMLNHESVKVGLKAEFESLNKKKEDFRNEMKKLVRPGNFKGGSPLSEIDRLGNGIAYFMVYAIGHGLTTEEILCVYKEAGNEKMSETTQKISEKIVNLSNDLSSGLKSQNSLKERKEYIADMYFDFFEAMETEGKKMAQFMANGTNDEFNALASILSGVRMSAMHQTFRLQATPSDDQIDTLVGIEDRMKKAGKKYSFDDVSSFLSPISAYPEFLPSESDVAQAFNDNLRLDVFDSFSSRINIFLDYRKQVRQLAKDRLEREVKNENIPFLSDEGIDAYAKANKFLFDVANSGENKEYKRSEAASHLGFGINIDVKTLSESMKSNERHNILGIKVSNSKEYNRISNLLSDITKVKDENPDADITDKYTELKEACKDYMDKRNPVTEEGRQRYGLALLAEAVANNGLCKFNEEDLEYDKCSESEMQTLAKTFQVSKHYQEIMASRAEEKTEETEKSEKVNVNILQVEEDKENGIVRKNEKDVKRKETVSIHKDNSITNGK